MYKIKATKKEMRQNHRILGVGYCGLQNLLNYEKPIAYSTRTEGWACDYYYIDDVLISTGYAPLASKNVGKDYETIKKYDLKAREISYNYNLSYQEKEKKIKKLLTEFLKEVKK